MEDLHQIINKKRTLWTILGITSLLLITMLISFAVVVIFYH